MFLIYLGRYMLEKGELTEEQFFAMKEAVAQEKDAILSESNAKQDCYEKFCQIMMDKTGMSLEELEEKMNVFKEEKNYSDEEFEALKTGDVEQVVSIFMKEPMLSRMHQTFITMTVRNLMQFVDMDLVLEPVVKLSPMQSQCVVTQLLFGDQQMFTVFAADQEVILDVASVFAEEEFTAVDPFSMDAIAELLNLSNGLYVSRLSEEGIELDLYPPMMYSEERTISSEGIAYVIPVLISGKRLNVIFSINTDVDVL